MAHSPDRVQVDHYGALELESGASESAVRTQYRRLALKYHPDKVGTSPETVAKFQAIAAAAEALAKPKFKMEYDQLMQNQEFYMLLPRCYAWMMMMIFWAAQFIIDMYEMEGRRENAKKQLYYGSTSGHIALNPHLLGVTKERLKQWVERPVDSTEGVSAEDRVNARIEQLPALLMGDHNDLMTLRKLLKDDGADVLPLPVKGAVLKVSVYSDRHKRDVEKKSEIAAHVRELLGKKNDMIRISQWEQEIPSNLMRDFFVDSKMIDEKFGAKIEGKDYSAAAVYATELSGKAPGKGTGAKFSVKFSKASGKPGKHCVEMMIVERGSGYQEKDELVVVCVEGDVSVHIPLIVDTVSRITLCTLVYLYDPVTECMMFAACADALVLLQVDEDAKNMYLFREHICREDGSYKEMKRALPSVAVLGGMSRTDIIRNVKTKKGRYDKNSAKQAKRQEGCAVM
jgi:hypothetical protein